MLNILYWATPKIPPYSPFLQNGNNNKFIFIILYYSIGVKTHSPSYLTHRKCQISIKAITFPIIPFLIFPQIYFYLFILHQFKSRMVCPLAFAGRLLQNLAQTTPLFPWARVPFPQITLVLSGLPPGATVLFFALYT